MDPAEFAQALQEATQDSSGYRVMTEQDLAGQTSTTDARVDQRSDPPALDMTITGGLAPGETQVRIVDDRVFVKGEGLTPDGTWAGSTPGEQNPFSELFLSMSEQFQSAGTPANFAETAQSVTRLGTEDDDGEMLEHYRVVIDAQTALANLGGALGGQSGPGGAGATPGPSAAPSAMPSAAPSAMPSAAPSAMPSLPETIEQDIYRDDQGRARRVEQSVGQVTTTTTISEWDSTFDITAPPDDQVTPFSELQGAGLGGGMPSGAPTPAPTSTG